MNRQRWFAKAKPGSLAESVRQAKPRLPLDDTIGRAVSNWVALDETTSRLAEPLAEPHVHRYLEEADRIGRLHGRSACFFVWWPSTALLFIVWILVVTRG